MEEAEILQNGRNELEPEQLEPGPQPITHPTVAVIRVPTENGNERIEIAELNGVDPLSVPTTLRLAARLKEQQLGIAEGR